MEAAKTCKRRVEHLKLADSAQGGAVTVWRKKRLDRMLVEYFLRAGYYNTALKLAKHSELVVSRMQTMHSELVASTCRPQAKYLELVWL